MAMERGWGSVVALPPHPVKHSNNEEDKTNGNQERAVPAGKRIRHDQ